MWLFLYSVSLKMNDVNHRRFVLAFLVNGVYILESDRQQNCDEIEALATPWWESFHFQLPYKLVDINKNSIFGAIYEYKYPNPSPSFPQYVIAFRGTILKKEMVLRDGKLNLNCFLNKLHKSSSFQLAMVRILVTMSGGARVWLAGHSLGSAMALLVGKNMAKMGDFLETYLFNPPFLSFPKERLKNEKKRKHMMNTLVCKILMTSDISPALILFIYKQP
ncbi:GDSL esterase/lipase At4g10955-like [Castanea sativa]|uniref:GDSL esterase/lipase At4g10955-like n=1 Tax=Castanea sativa TaxID=21020 RepID=UPI003F649D1A